MILHLARCESLQHECWGGDIPVRDVAGHIKHIMLEVYLKHVVGNISGVQLRRMGGILHNDKLVKTSVKQSTYCRMGCTVRQR